MNSEVKLSLCLGTAIGIMCISAILNVIYIKEVDKREQIINHLETKITNMYYENPFSIEPTQKP